jgi:hypothetical protein
LYGGLLRKDLTLKLKIIFDYNNVNAEGQIVYYLAFMCEPKTRNLWRFK